MKTNFKSITLGALLIASQAMIAVPAQAIDIVTSPVQAMNGTFFGFTKEFVRDAKHDVGLLLFGPLMLPFIVLNDKEQIQVGFNMLLDQGYTESEVNDYVSDMNYLAEKFQDLNVQTAEVAIDVLESERMNLSPVTLEIQGL